MHETTESEPSPAERTDALSPADIDAPPNMEEWQVRGEDLPDREAASPGLEMLREEWGEQYEANLEGARRLVGEIATPELIEAVERSGLGDDPHLLRAVAEIARRLYSGPDGGTSRASGEDRIQARLDELHALQYADAPQRRAAYRSPRVQAELERLYETLHGTHAAFGRDSRGA